MDEKKEEKSLLLNFRGQHGNKLIRINVKPKEKKGIHLGYMGYPYAYQQEDMQHREKADYEKYFEAGSGIDLPKIETDKIEIEDTEEIEKINLNYPLIPQIPKKGERVFAYTSITLDRGANELVYNLVEPQLDSRGVAILNEMKEYIQEKMDINFSQVRKRDAISFLLKIFDKAVEYFRIKTDIEVLKYYIIRDFIGLEKIEPLMQDKNIEDISCDGIKIPIYIYHRNPKIGSIRTNIMFNTKEELDSFMNKLSERCGKSISVAKYDTANGRSFFILLSLPLETVDGYE